MRLSRHCLSFYRAMHFSAEILPFEIIQDGGGRHLEFVRIENSVIRSTVPENHTL